VNGSTATEGLSGSGRAGRSWRCSRNGTGRNPERPYWSRDVFELLVAQILKGKVEFTGGILLYARRHADPGGERIQARKALRDDVYIKLDVPRPRSIKIQFECELVHTSPSRVGFLIFVALSIPDSVHC
jgi:hypothetical protein